MNWKMPANTLVTLVALVIGTPATDAADATDNLASPESFASIADTAARSAAMFAELGKVLTDPRCVNCHPAGDRPRQSEQGRLHQPPVQRGADGHGLPAMRCSICHQQARSEEHTSELQSLRHLVCRLLLEKKKKTKTHNPIQDQ